MRKIKLTSAAKPSLYAYSKSMKEKKAEKHEKVATAVLSIATRQNFRKTVGERGVESLLLNFYC